MKRAKAMLVLALAAGHASQAQAWEAQTTHAGLAEQAALASTLHKRLVAVGFTGGLFEPLTIPPADAPVLMQNLKLLSPTHGAVPDARGRQTAIAWLAAGASLADIPARHGVNHFYDPATQRGWERPGRGLIEGLTKTIREAVGRVSVPDKGMPAVDWITAKDNPFNLSQFLDQYAKAVSAATPGERSRHMAAALVAAGGLLHVLGDMGTPSRVRGDEAAHYDELGGGPDDLGSRFERIAALAHGRLGVPAPAGVVTRERMRDYFTNAAGTGLADVISRSYFSPNTLPARTRTGSDTKPRLARPQPVLPTRLNLMAASREDGTTLRNKAETCLARYKVENGMVVFHLDDECMLEQVDAILPEVSAFETGLLDFLLRGEITLTLANGQLTLAGSANLATGDVDILAEDSSGVRKSIGKLAGKAGEIGRISVPGDAVRVVAVFRGADTVGEPLVAIGGVSLTAQ